MLNPDLRTCCRCRIDKPLTSEFFPSHKQCRGGLDTTCRECRRAYNRIWKKKNGTRLRQFRREAYASGYAARNQELERLRRERAPFLVTAQILADGIRERSKKKGWDRPSAICTAKFFLDWLRRQSGCPCCGTPFHLGPKNGVFTDASPSIDRFDPSRGYDLDNIEMICWRCNNIKRNYSAADLLLVARWIEGRPAQAKAA